MVQKFIYFSNTTFTVYRLVICKVRYFKPLFVITLMIVAYSFKKNLNIRIL